MPITKVPPASSLTDKQFVSVMGPDSIASGFQYDAQTRTLFAKESQVIFPDHHGASHVAEDPIPEASCDSRGLMSADDKCKLDGILQTRVGILGYSGAGFPDDGGWLSGDIILGVGSEFISIERVGNLVRFTVDSPIPLTCSCESCQQIFWVQDESEVSAVRPPACSGKFPGVNGYGELKIYLYPESTQVAANPATTLLTKGVYPSLIFKRYDDGITPNQAEYDLVLKRNSQNQATTEVGWAFTPGAAGVPQCIWYMGRDNDLNQISFQLNPSLDSGLLGGLLYKGHLLTKQMAVVTAYTSTVLSTNQYTMRYWDVDNAQPVNDPFTATNVWKYNNPEQPATGLNPRTLALDSVDELLPLGTLVDIWEFQIGSVNGVPTLRRYFSQAPRVNLANAWGSLGAVEFGNTLSARLEVQPGTVIDVDDADVNSFVSDERTLDRDIWGITGLYDPLIYAQDLTGNVGTAGTAELSNNTGTAGIILNTADAAKINTNLPGLMIDQDLSQSAWWTARPVFLWNRIAHNNSLVTASIGKPSVDAYPPYDFLMHAPVDEHETTYLHVAEVGTISGLHMIRVSGAHYNDLPQRGFVRILTRGATQNSLFKYSNKFIFPADPNTLILAGTAAENDAYVGSVGDVVELLHEDYDSPCVRLEFGLTDNVVSLQVKVGILGMDQRYENDEGGFQDDQVRGLRPGYAISAVYTQDGFYDGTGSRPVSAPTDFVCYNGGFAQGGAEFWNDVELMLRDGQAWVWWNKMLITPSTTLSSQLPTPAFVNTPYFPIQLADMPSTGKVGLRLWPGSRLRRMEVRSQLRQFSEYTNGQLLLT